jgi:uncharacterized protein
MSIPSRILAGLCKLPPAETYALEIERNIPVPMSDGVKLLADHYYPRGVSRMPLILVRSPYGRAQLNGLMYGHLFAERGFQVLVQSCRGTFGSGGQLTPFFNESSDGLDTIEWIKKQPWFNGQLATMGASYLGYVQWAIAARAQPVLKAMSLTVTASQFRSQTYPGDAFSLQDPLGWTHQMNMQEKAPLKLMLMRFGIVGDFPKAFGVLPLGQADEFLLGKKVGFWQDWLHNSRPDYEWWQPADFSATVKNVSVPVNMVTGWYDIFLPWQMADYAEMQKVGNPPQLTVGPWWHTSNPLTACSLRESLSWLRAQLKNQKDQLRRLPVRLFVMGSNSWKDFPVWPPPQYQSQAWYLQPGRALAVSQPAACGPDQYIYDPANPTPSLGGATMALGGSRDNRKLETRSDILTFTSEPLARDNEVIGPLSAELYISSNRPSADFIVRLCDVRPSGQSMNISDGIRRIRSGQPAAAPDGVVRLNIEMWPTAYLFKRGHRIRLQVASGAFPHFARNLGSDEPLATAAAFFKAEQKIYHDPTHPSAVFLPVLKS